MSTNLPTLTLRDESQTPSCAQKQILPSPKVAWQGRALFAVEASLWNSPPAPFFVSAHRLLKSAFRKRLCNSHRYILPSRNHSLCAAMNSDSSTLPVTLLHVVDPIYPGAWLHQGQSWQCRLRECHGETQNRQSMTGK